MKKLILVLFFIVLMAIPCFGAFTTTIGNRKTYKNAYRWTGKPKDLLLDWAQEVENRADGTSTTEFTYYNPTDSVPASNEGTLYYDLSESKLKYHNGSSFIAIEAGSTGNSLDGAYDVGRSITVDAGPVVLTTDTGSGIIALSLDHGGASNNSDALAIAHAGSGDGLQITVEDTDSVAARLIASAAQAVSLAVFEGSTSDWDGADDVGMVHINTDAPLIHTGASLFMVTQSGTPIASAEGFLARFIQSGTAQTNATAVEIQVKATQPALAVNGITKINGQTAAGDTLFTVAGVGASGDADAMDITNDGAGDCLEITPTDVDTGGINMVAKAAGVVPLIIVDGVTGDWDGADDKGMINITHDTALIHAGSSLLNINQTTAVKSDAEGFLARFVSDATKQASAFAVEIEVTNQQPALKVNNNVTIVGADESGELLTITHVGATGDADAMSIASSGSGDSLIISPTDTDSGGINVVGKAAGTVPLVILDSSTNNMNLADDKGQLLIQQDAAYAHAGAAGLVILDTASTPISAAEGFLARFAHAGTAQTNAYAVGITVPATQPAFKSDGIVVIDGQDSIGATLFQIINDSGSDNQDAMSINSEGTGDGLQITCDDIDSVGLHMIGKAAQTTTLVNIVGDAGAGWTGAAGVGLVNITNDSTATDADAALINILSTGNLAIANDGVCLELEETGSAQATTYVMRIASTNNEALHVDTGVVLIDETLTATLGIQVGVGETLTAAAAEGAGQQVDDDITVANVTAAGGATDYITLPNDPTIGTVVKVMCNVGTNFEIRTLTSGNDKINNVDTSDNAVEYLATDGDMIIFTCVKADNWQGVSYPIAGGVRAAVTPD